MKQNYRLSAKQNVPENALFDETTCHIFVEEDGQVIEKKYCSYCHDWHPLSEYYYHKHSFDKLNCWCKCCRKERDRNHKREELMKRKNACENELNKINEQLRLL